MATFREVVEGLTILSKYSPKGMDESCEAQHDELFACPDISAGMVTAEDANKLEDLGWHFSSEFDCWARFT